MDQHCQHNDDLIANLRAQMAANDKEHESFRRRLNDHDEKMDCLIELTGSVKSLAVSMDQTKKTVEKIDKRVEKIEDEPGDKWKRLWFEIIKYIVLAIVGAMVGYYIKG